MIKSYNEFLIIESSEIEESDDINDIFSEFIDDGYKLDIDKAFFNEEVKIRESENTNYKIPGIKINLKKDQSIGKMGESSILSIINKLGESIDRMSDFGEVVIKHIDMDLHRGNKITIYILQNDKELKLSENPKFYDFLDSLKINFRKYSNKVTNSFTIENDDKSIILIPNEGVDSKKMLSGVKSQLKKLYNPWYSTGVNRRRYEYEYEVKLIGDKIHIFYKNFYNLDRSYRRIME